MSGFALSKYFLKLDASSEFVVRLKFVLEKSSTAYIKMNTRYIRSVISVFV